MSITKRCGIVLLSISALLTSVNVRAQTPAPPIVVGLPPSLQFASEDASFYYALMNNRLKWDVVAENPAVQQLLAMPVVQRAIADARDEMVSKIQSNLDDAKTPTWARNTLAFWSSQEGQAYLPTIASLASRELFVFADKSLAEQYAALNTMMSEQLAKIDLDEDSSSEELNPFEDLADSPANRDFLDKLQVPRIVAGANMSGASEQQRARELLSMLVSKFRNEFLQLSDAENKYILDSLTHQNAGQNNEQWVLHLTVDDYPWDAALQRMSVDAEPEEVAALEKRFAKIRDRAAGKSLVLGVGFADGYLYASLGHDPDQVAPNKVEQPLYRRDTFKPLLKNRGKAFSGIGYQNSTLKQQTSWVTQWSMYLRMIPSIAKSMLSDSELDPLSYQPLLADIDQDVEMLQADLKRLYNPLGEQLTFAFFFDGGIAGYQHHHHTDPIRVQAQPLKSLQHIGEKPALFSAAADWDDDGTLDKWLNRIQQRAKQAMDLAAESGNASPTSEMDPAMTTGLTELFLATKDDLLPSVGNEAAFVLDFDRRSQQWHPAMPPAPNALPIPAPALVYNLTDTERHRRAWRRYFDTINPLFAAFGPLMGLPPGQGLPAATESTISGDVHLQIPGVELLGADPKFSPGLALTSEWAVYSLFRGQAVDLAQANSPSFPSPLNDLSRPLIAAGHVDLMQCADAAQAWMDYAMPIARQINRNQRPPTLDTEPSKTPSLEETAELVTIAIDLLRQVPSYTHATYVQDNSVVKQYVIKVPTLRPAAAKQE
ncbi:hypothetical protein SAMN06265222_12918 [Neorhodopirellula lusitana]|uniref:Uncharacterized protein n=1 Tax=Neorhodopirellula lusitana TaxID=445327 RepID=A0ABY1QST6_9BACT|nr:hypothetical protein [Neorhodopirellula lusitana]SMP79128.1 hypothetical protein SAMN06265222_12918 [Neorhodopirellula lusitana]